MFRDGCCAGFLAIALICSTIFTQPPHAAEITIEPTISDGIQNFSSCQLYIVGRIESPDAEKFRVAVLTAMKRGCQIKQVAIYSLGGDLKAAMNIGEQISVLAIETQGPTQLEMEFKSIPSPPPTRTCLLEPVDSFDYIKVIQGKGAPRSTRRMVFYPRTGKGDPRCTCASACFFVWLGGAKRSGNFILVHRPYFDPKEYASMTITEARQAYLHLTKESLAYLEQMGVPEGLRAKIFSISSENSARLTDQELSFLRSSPYREELVIAKCGKRPAETVQEKALSIKGADIRVGDPKSFEAMQTYIRCIADAEREISTQARAEYLRRYGP